MRLLPPSNVPPRVTCFSICLPSHPANQAGARERVIERYLELFDEFEIPVTWGLVDPTNRDRVAQLRSRPLAHEIALYHQADPQGARTGRQAAAVPWPRQVSAAKGAGCEVVTLVCRGPSDQDRGESLTDWCGGLVRAGIRMVVRDRITSTNRYANHPIKTLRYGLWEMESSLVMGDERMRAGGLGLRRRVDRAMSAGGLCHVALGEAVTADRQVLRPLERLFRHVARRRQERQLEVQTISQVALQLPRRRSGRPAQSILRRPSPIPYAA
ncbi:MAG: hypothetical protein GTO03_16200 [Planctomycetales bacterium]|nr:hypothetical protein [Planctomycetales bacterium]